jgi:hypothetical protein
MNELETKLELIKRIMVAEEKLLDREPKGLWYNDKFDSLYDEDILSLQFKVNLLKRKVEDGRENKDS